MDNKCVLPFINQDFQFNNPCCMLRNFDAEKDTEKLIDDHNKNTRSKFCDLCWATEDIGIKSHRQIHNEKHEHDLALTERAVSIATIPVGNVCNLHCVICHPYLSTSWLKKWQKAFPEMPQDGKVMTDIKVSDVRDIGNYKHVEFIGGETLKSTSLWEYLETLDKDMSFSLQTNGTVVLTKYQVDLINSFKNFNICFSLDGYGKIFEYIRQPAKWEQVCENVKKYIKYFGLEKLGVYITINNLNILYIDKIVLNIFKLVPAKLQLNFVHDPIEFAYNNLDKQTGMIVEKNNPVFFKKHSVEWIGNSSTWEATLDNLKRQDKFSRLKLQDYLPELFALKEGVTH